MAIVLSPCNWCRGKEQFTVLPRKVNSLERALFSVMICPHQRIVAGRKQISLADPKKLLFMAYLMEVNP